MERSQWYIGAVNGVVLCIDSNEDNFFKGRVYHAYNKGVIKVCCIEQLLFALDEFYNSIEFPYPSNDERTFQEKREEKDFKIERERIMSDKELLNKHGDLGTFIIRVQHRQNSSWQGRITWMDKNKTLSFRSVWEMIKLIASALDTVSKQDDASDGKSWN
jgi:hypothetical protein